MGFYFELSFNVNSKNSLALKNEKMLRGNSDYLYFGGKHTA